MSQSEQLDKFGAAFVAAQADMTNPHKNAKNPFHNSMYASLEECNKQAHTALNAHDIGILQGVHDNKLRTTLIHKSGQWMSDEGVPLDGIENAKNKMQAAGSAITYARRYGVCAMVGLAQTDDDGNALNQDVPKPRRLARERNKAKPSGKDLDKLFPKNDVQEAKSGASGAKGPEKADASPGASEGNTDEVLIMIAPNGKDTAEFASSLEFVEAFKQQLTKMSDDTSMSVADRRSAMHRFEEHNEPSLDLLPEAAAKSLYDERLRLNASISKGEKK